MNINNLKNFLIYANAVGYAGGEENKWSKDPDGSTSIAITRGKWRSHDNFFGGEPYGGRIVVFFEEKPVWMMMYYGWVEEDVETDKVYKILRSALNAMPEDAPFRGPKEFIYGEYVYKNDWVGDVENYAGEEHIYESGKLIYKANYLGGMVDKRQGV